MKGKSTAARRGGPIALGKATESKGGPDSKQKAAASAVPVRRFSPDQRNTFGPHSAVPSQAQTVPY